MKAKGGIPFGLELDKFRILGGDGGSCLFSYQDPDTGFPNHEQLEHLFEFPGKGHHPHGPKPEGNF
jgi:hypothetical protein